MIKTFEEFIKMNESKVNESINEGIIGPFPVEGFDDIYCALSEEDENTVYVFVEDTDEPVAVYIGLEWPESSFNEFDGGGAEYANEINYYPSKYKNDPKLKELLEDSDEFINAVFKTFIENEVLEDE